MKANKEAASLIADDSSASVPLVGRAVGCACTSSTIHSHVLPSKFAVSFFFFFAHLLHPSLPPALPSSRLLCTSQVPDLPVQPLQPPTSLRSQLGQTAMSAPPTPPTPPPPPLYSHLHTPKGCESPADTLRRSGGCFKVEW